MQDHATFSRDAFAPFGARLGAFVIDGIILGVVTFVVLVGLAIANGGELQLEGFGMAVAWLLTGIAWDALWIAGPARAKPGQRLAGFLVLRPDGSRVPLGRAVLRGFVKAVSCGFLAISFVINAITIVATPQRQAIHDLFATTVCVRRSVVSEASSVQHVPTSAQRATPVARPADSEATRHKGPFM